MFTTYLYIPQIFTGFRYIPSSLLWCEVIQPGYYFWQTSIPPLNYIPSSFFSCQLPLGGVEVLMYALSPGSQEITSPGCDQGTFLSSFRPSQLDRVLAVVSCLLKTQRLNMCFLMHIYSWDIYLSVPVWPEQKRKLWGLNFSHCLLTVDRADIGKVSRQMKS